ncbi:alpha-L-fucosidase [Salegentibacter sp. BLCTC]|uniref:alpha-L-fucosidase n=1 Tax=Salegentibacter echinorum TaxID=1073325 RepID=A0A1M5FQL1_SALEC|nr:MULTISPECIES: alpha-L-fucosidase [Salegentibacter]MBE7639096.1 alpha-L-fucosidase [Salegentibacter sp. BLCTC]SHF93793.1 alpha-L-fucosidase [Salegentibacter echinorum]
MRNLKFLVLVLCAIVSTLGQEINAQQKKIEPNWESIDSRPVPSWFEDAKFGIFIHWGPYSVPAWSPKGTYAEWYQYWLQSKSLFGNGDFSGTEVYDHHVKTYGPHFSYYNFGEQFTARDFDADKWAELFENAGAKYMMITSKHHDGFTLWPSETANKTWGFPWNAKDVGAKRDLLKELEVAVKKTDVKFGTYYSLYEWFNPLWKEDKEKFALEHMHPQFKDLVENYKPDLIWSDGDWDMSAEKWHSPELLAWLFNESAVGDEVVINDRWGDGIRFNHGGYFTTEYQSELDGSRPWEECRGIGFSFGYNTNEDAWDYASERTLIYLLLNVVSNGGNLLLDIGPDAQGNIPPIMQDRLLAIGDWLKVNGEAIYGTRKWERACQWSKKGKKDWKPEGTHYLPADYILKQTIDPEPGYAVREIFFTKKGSDLFAIVPKWPKNTLIIKDVMVTDQTEINLIGTNLKIEFVQKGKDLVLKVPNLTNDELPSKYAYSFKITNIKK